MADWWEELKATTGAVKKKAKKAATDLKGYKAAPQTPDESAKQTTGTRDLSASTAASRLKGRKAQIDRAIDDL